MFFKKALNSILDFLKIKIPIFCKNNFEITSTKLSKIVGSVICFVTLIAVILDVGAYTSQDFAAKWLLLAFALICPFILGITAAYSVRIKSDIMNKIWHSLFLFYKNILYLR